MGNTDNEVKKDPHIAKAEEIVQELMTLPDAQRNEVVAIIYKSVIDARKTKREDLHSQAKTLDALNDELKKIISGGKMTENNHQ